MTTRILSRKEKTVNGEHIEITLTQLKTGYKVVMATKLGSVVEYHKIDRDAVDSFERMCYAAFECIAWM